MKYSHAINQMYNNCLTFTEINQTNKQNNTTYINNLNKVVGRGHWNQLWKEINYDFSEIIH